MSEQGERPSADDWWTRLYDASALDTGPAVKSGDTLDDRFDSAAGTVNADGAADRPVDPRDGGPGARPPAWREQAPPAAPYTAPPAAPYTPGDAGPLPRTDARDAAPPPPAPKPSPPPAPSTPSAPAAPFVPSAPAVPSASPVPVPAPASASGPRAVPDPRSVPGSAPAPDRARVTHLGDRPPTYDPEPATLPAAHPDRLDELVADTVLDGASYGTYTLRAVSVRGDSARHRGEPRHDALLTARFGAGPGALVLVAVAGGARAAEGAHRAAGDVCHWIGGAVGRSHGKLSEDIRADRRDALKSGLHRLTDRGFGKLRARAAELGLAPEEYTASLRCLLLPADPDCRTRVFFGVGAGGLFRLRGGGWQDLEPPVTADAPAHAAAETPEDDRTTMDLEITKAHVPYIEGPLPPPPEPFRFRASVGRPGDTFLLCSAGLAEPLRGEPALAGELAGRWAAPEPPGLADFLADTALRVKGYADDRTAVGVWEA
ncbi:protein phosphatase 2C domain-containing protein [Streptomyces sp. NPDC059092]|uniref:protein phosphatase 2C domain-containing protein n=1 Tax=Streptomyces sp. NPDC059092 TaxID=3346725 RepID=UPI0036C01FFE